MSGILIAMGLGILNTMTLHIAKGMMRHGIDGIHGPNSKTKRHRRLRAIYFSGMTLTFTNALWLIISSKFAPASYFTSMYGVGIITLLGYSHFFLGEKLTRRHLFFAGLILSGTVMIGISQLFVKPVPQEGFIASRIYLILAGTVLPLFFLTILFVKQKNLRMLAVVSGLITGVTGSYDPIFKGLAQNIGGISRYIPASIEGWIPYILSFALTALAYLVTHWAFSKHVEACFLVPVHTGTYVLMPLFVQILTLPGFTVSPWVAPGGALIVTGSFFLSRLP